MNTPSDDTTDAPTDLADVLATLHTHARRGARYWRRGVLLTALILTAGLSWAARRPRVYTSIAAFEVAAPEGSELGADARDRQLEQRAAQAWDTQSAALSVIDAERLYPTLQGHTSRERQARAFQSHLRWRVEGGAVHLGFSHDDPAVASRVAHRLIARFSDERTADARERARIALTTAETQLAQAETARLSHASALTRFESEHAAAIAQLRARELGVTSQMPSGTVNPHCRSPRSPAVEPSARETLPEVDAQWTRLRSNLATASATVQTLLQQKYHRQAEVARVELVGAEPMRVIDAPSRPMDPDPPGRAKLSTIVALAALVLGGGLSVLSGAMDPRIYEADDLARWGELAVWESIPEIKSARS